MRGEGGENKKKRRRRRRGGSGSCSSCSFSAPLKVREGKLMVKKVKLPHSLPFLNG